MRHTGKHKNCKECKVLNLFFETHGKRLGLAEAV